MVSEGGLVRGEVVRGQPPPLPGSEVNHSPTQGQRSTTSPSRVKGQQPPQVTYGSYGQWAGGTHPTGMHIVLALCVVTENFIQFSK